MTLNPGRIYARLIHVNAQHRIDETRHGHEANQGTIPWPWLGWIHSTRALRLFLASRIPLHDTVVAAASLLASVGIVTDVPSGCTCLSRVICHTGLLVGVPTQHDASSLPQGRQPYPFCLRPKPRTSAEVPELDALADTVLASELSANSLRNATPGGSTGIALTLSNSCVVAVGGCSSYTGCESPGFLHAGPLTYLTFFNNQHILASCSQPLPLPSHGALLAQ